jgi:decaprenylphospho-beta-D-ribofuranose 2-oxidase
MGLTGVITEATVRLIPIETDRLLVDTERATDLDDLMARMESGDADYRYSVAWVDLASRGRGFGRGVLTRGDHAPAEALPPTAREAPRRFAARTLATVPPWVPSGLVRRETVRIFNELYFRRAPAHRAGELLGIAPFFYPLDIAGQWNRLYGPAGFLQYQCVVPFGREETLTRIARTINESRNVASLVVLKRFGAADPAPLSFPIPGWTLAVDFPLPGDGLGVLLDGLDELVADAGGRLYLAKDSRLRPELVPAMYPRLDEWRRTRAAMDPAGTMQSDLSRRLRLL